MASQAHNHIVEIKLLQNGFTLKEVEIPLHSKRFISITNQEADLLGILLYPISRDIPVLEITKKNVELIFDQAWEGFVSVKGQLKDVRGQQHLGGRVELFPGDYASVAWHDLRLLVSIRPPRKKPRKTMLPSGNFLASPFSTLINGSYEWTSNILSAVICGAITLGIYSEARQHPSKKPTDFRDLPPQISLHFIHPANIYIAPELLQENLEIAKPIPSILNWYQNYLSNAFSWKQTSTIVEHKVIGDKAKQQYDDYVKVVGKLKENYDLASDATARSPINSQITTPVIIGPTFSQRALAVLNRMQIVTDSAKTRLDTKREIIGKFIVEPKYDWENYQRKVPKKRLGNTEPVPTPTAPPKGPEQEMYDSFVKLAENAKELQDSFVPAFPDQDLLKSTKGLVLKAAPGVIGLSDSAIPRIDIAKLKYMPVSVFGAKKQALKPIEPMSGFVDNSALKKALLSQKMEIQLCYEASLRRSLAHQGKMTWEWVLDTEGNISDIELVASDIADNDLARCIRRKIAVFTLPKAKRGSVKVSHIFEFRPEKNL